MTKREKNMLPPSRREARLLQGHRIIESVFSGWDRLGFSERPYRKSTGPVVHLYAVLLIQPPQALRRLSRPAAPGGAITRRAFPNWGQKTPQFGKG